MKGKVNDYETGVISITRQTVGFHHDGDYWLDIEACESALAEDDADPEMLQALREAVEGIDGDS